MYSKYPIYPNARLAVSLQVDARRCRHEKAGVTTRNESTRTQGTPGDLVNTRRMRRDPLPSPRAKWKEFVARRNATNERVAFIGMHRARRMDTLRGDTVLNLSVRDRWNLSGEARAIVADFAL